MGKEFFPLSRNPSNSNKTRILHRSTCTGSLPVPPNSLGKSAPHTSAAFPPISLQRHSVQLAPACSRPSAQHTAMFSRAQVENHLPLESPPTLVHDFPNLFASKEFCFSIHNSFLHPQSLLR
jgi:hypothetical protein